MRISLLTALLITLSSPALADSTGEMAGDPGSTLTAYGPHALDLDYSVGVDRHQLDGYTRVTGWRFGESWYFGKQKGGIGGLALVWQGERDQMTFSTEGLRLIRRF